MKRYSIFACCCVILALGCNDNGGRVSVEGTVTLDGQPVNDATLAFFPEPGCKGQGGYGKSDENGHYEIAYPYSGKGLVPGPYRVIVMKGTAQMPVESAEGVIDSPLRNVGVPGKYGNPETTPLRVTIEPNGQPIDFALETGKAKKDK